MSEDGTGGVGITRMSAEDEDGVKDFSFVNSDLIQEGISYTEYGDREYKYS